MVDTMGKCRWKIGDTFYIMEVRSLSFHTGVLVISKGETGVLS